MMVTVVVLMRRACGRDFGVGAVHTLGRHRRLEKAGPFEFAFENYTALGYGDAVAGGGYRLIGPITALNGLLLIGWSVAIIFEVMRMAEVQIAAKAQIEAR